MILNQIDHECCHLETYYKADTDLKQFVCYGCEKPYEPPYGFTLAYAEGIDSIHMCVPCIISVLHDEQYREYIKLEQGIADTSSNAFPDLDSKRRIAEIWGIKEPC